MRRTSFVSFGWGATLLLLALSILAAVRLATVSGEILEIIAEPDEPAIPATTDIVALIEPAAVDSVSAALEPAFATARDGDRYPFRVFSPGLPTFLAQATAMVETLDIAHEAGVDAIVVRPDRAESLHRAGQIAADGVVTAVFGSLVPDVAVHIRVGVDPRELGEVIASQVADDARIGYLCGLCAGPERASAEHLLDAVEARLARAGAPAPSLVVQRVDDVELGSIAAARSLLVRDVDVVFCDTTEATIAMAQVVIDANVVGGVQIVGFGGGERVVSLVEDRVVHATVAADYAAAAERTLARVVDLLAGTAGSELVGPARPATITPELRLIGTGGDGS